MAKPALPTLIKLAKQRVEQVQQALAQNRATQTELQQAKQTWQEDAAQAVHNAAASSELAAFQAATAFRTRSDNEIMKLNDKLRALSEEEAQLQTALQSAFAEQKRFELLAERQALEARREAQRKQQEMLDDLRRPRNEN